MKIENPSCGQNENPFCSSVGNQNSFCSCGPASFARETRCFQRGKSGKGKCGRAEIGHIAHAANVQIVRIIQMNSRSEHKKCLTGGCGGSHFPLPRPISNPALYVILFLSIRLEMVPAAPRLLRNHWCEAPRPLCGHSVRSTFPLNEPIAAMVFQSYAKMAQLWYFFRTHPLTCDFASQLPCVTVVIP